MGKLSNSLLVSTISVACLFAVACQQGHNGATNTPTPGKIEDVDKKLTLAEEASAQTQASLDKKPDNSGGKIASVLRLENELLASASLLRTQSEAVKKAKEALDKMLPVPLLDASLMQAVTKKPVNPAADKAKLEALPAEVADRQKRLAEAIQKLEEQSVALQNKIETARTSALRNLTDASFDMLDPSSAYPFLFIVVGGESKEKIAEVRALMSQAMAKNKKHAEDFAEGELSSTSSSVYDRYVVYNSLNEVKVLFEKVLSLSPKLVAILRPIDKVVVNPKVVVTMQDDTTYTFKIGAVGNVTLDQVQSKLEQPYTYLFNNNTLTCKEVDGDCIKALKASGSLNYEIAEKKVPAHSYLASIVDRSIEAVAKIEEAPGAGSINDKGSKGVYYLPGGLKITVSEDKRSDLISGISISYEVAIQDLKSEFGEMPIVAVSEGFAADREKLTYPLPLSSADSTMPNISKVQELKKFLAEIRKALE